MRTANLKNLIAAWILSLVIICTASGDVIVVNPGESIRAAIDSAFYGDTVEVSAGTYHERITLKNGVAVIGAGARVTIIDGDAGGSVVTSNGCDANTVLEGFTITDGQAANGGGMYNNSPTVTNCIMWGDSAGTSGDEIYNVNSTPPAISYSDIAGCGGSGTVWNVNLGNDLGGNIDADPLFAGDLHLKSEFGRVNTDPSMPIWLADTVTSPCIDAGDPNMNVGNELEGNGGRINMGRYGGTYQASKSSYVETIEGDVNGDRRVDFRDIAVVAGNWLAGNEP